MRRLSQETSRLVQQLYLPIGWVDWAGTGRQRMVHAIEQIADSGEIAAILPLLAQLVDSPRRIGQAAAEAMARLVASCRPEDLFELDANVRWQTDWNLGHRWLHLAPHAIANLPKPSHAPATVLGLVSFHADGHVREAAVRLLDGVEDGSEIPFLLLRLNDWVAPVQRSARLAVERRLRTGSIDRFADHLYLIVRLLDQRRSDHASLVEAFILQLTRAEHESLLLGCVNASNRQVRRTIFRLAVEMPGAHVTRLVAAGLRAGDPVIRLWAVRKAPLVFEAAELDRHLQWTDGDAFLAVRRETLRVRASHLPATSHPKLLSALLDRSASVREEACFHLRQRGDIDIVDFYRKAILDHRELQAAIEGLGETGAEADAALALPFLNAPASRLRKAAVRTVGRLSPARNRGGLLQRLTDDSPHVAYAAAGMLAIGPLHDVSDQLWAAFCSDSRVHVKLAVLHLLNQLGTWQKLPRFIYASADSNERVAARAMGGITSIYNRVFTRPSQEDANKVRKALQDTQDRLPPAFEAELHSWVNIWTT